MENATQAIRIAGGILIAMLVLSIIVLGIRRVSHYEQEKHKSIEVEQITEFNKPLLSYQNAIVSGFRMISLANLANDNNVRFSELIDEYIPIKIYAGLMSNVDGIYLPGWLEGAGQNKQVTLSTGNKSTKKYFNMIDYVGTTGHGPYYYKTTGEEQDKSTQTQFKNLYFQCIDISYDETTGRVIQMVFDEIKKRN